jgi:transketolase
MGAIVNGLSLSKLRAFGATFFIFSDYLRPAIRLSALMELPTIFVFTHDAMGDGEDGPTHQPVEHLASLREGARRGRAGVHFRVGAIRRHFRPCDRDEDFRSLGAA